MNAINFTAQAKAAIIRDHESADWGMVSKYQEELNNKQLAKGTGILISSYELVDGEGGTVRIFTDLDEGHTTVTIYNYDGSIA